MAGFVPAVRAPAVIASRENEVPVAVRQITLSLNRSEAIPGAPIRLTETIPIGLAAKVRVFYHEVVLIGRYDPEIDEMVPVEFNRYRHPDADWIFDDLYDNLHFSHATEPEALTPSVKGTEFEFKAKRLGIFLIRATWGLEGKARDITGPPIVLVVSPPRDAKGKPVVKPEWLKEVDE